ncbi:MAG: glycerol-3-phosphate dehydrogenase/oxidase [bacterium]
MPSDSPPATFDVAVIGGGINGAGIAQCAAACGYSTLLIEKGELGGATSSSSSKLIHGGLRYLQSGHIGMVYESLRERRILRRLAPDLVRPNTFYIPLYNDSSFKPWYIATGLFMYSALTGFSRNNRFRYLPEDEWHSLPLLKQENLKAVLAYQDAQTDDQVLTQRIARSAQTMGAEIRTNTQLLGATRTDEGYSLSYAGTTSSEPQQQSASCRVLINAAGPWVNLVADQVSPPPPKTAINLVQGSHLIMSPQLSEQCFYLESPTDKRAVFVLPWKGKTLLGTTETVHKGDPGDAALLDTERAYLVDVLGHYFPDYQPSIEGSTAGLRVLPQSGDDVHSTSREVILTTDDKSRPSYIAVYGGKLTTYRSTAEKVMKLAAEGLGGSPDVKRTRELRLG